MNASLWQLAGWTMIHSLWIGGAVALAGGFLRLAARRAAPNTRYAISLATLAALAASPLAAAAWLSVNGVPQLAPVSLNSVLLPPPGGEGWGGGMPTVDGMQFASSTADIQETIQTAPPLLYPSLTLPLKERGTKDIQVNAHAPVVIDLAHLPPSPQPAGEWGDGFNPLPSTPSANALVADDFPNATVGSPAPSFSPARGAPLPTAYSPTHLLTPYLTSAIPYLPALWLVGAPLTFTLLAAGLVGSARLRRRATPLSSGPAFDACQRMRAALRITRRVALAACDGVAQPVLVGVFRPLILLPTAAAGWTPEQLDMILLHELAHVRRWDNLVNLLQRIVESILFYHPAVWILSRQVRHDREECCDAAVIRHTDRPHQYAELLVSIAAALRGGPAPSLAVASAMASHPLAGRIRRILNIEAEPMRITRRTLAATLLLPAILAGAIFYSGASAQDGSSPPSKEQPSTLASDERAQGGSGETGGIPDASQPSTVASEEDASADSNTSTHAETPSVSQPSTSTNHEPAANFSAPVDDLAAEIARLEPLVQQHKKDVVERDVLKTILSNDSLSSHLIEQTIRDSVHRDPDVESATSRLREANVKLAYFTHPDEPLDETKIRRLQQLRDQLTQEVVDARENYVKQQQAVFDSIPQDRLHQGLRERLARIEESLEQFEAHAIDLTLAKRMAEARKAAPQPADGPRSSKQSEKAAGNSASTAKSTDDDPISVTTYPLDGFPANVDMHRWMEIIATDPRIEVQWMAPEKLLVIVAPKSRHEQIGKLLNVARKSEATNNAPPEQAATEPPPSSQLSNDSTANVLSTALAELEQRRQSLIAAQAALSNPPKLTQDALIEKYVDIILKKDVGYAAIKQQGGAILNARKQLTSSGATSDDATIQQLDASFSRIKQELNAYRESTKADVARRAAAGEQPLVNDILSIVAERELVRAKSNALQAKREFDDAQSRLTELANSTSPHVPKATASSAASENADAPPANPDISQIQEQIRNLEAIIAKVQEDRTNLEVFRELARQGAASPALIEKAIAQELETDQTLKAHNDRLQNIDRMIASEELLLNNKSLNQDRETINKLNEIRKTTGAKRDAYQTEATEKLRERIAKTPNEALRAAVVEYKIRSEAIEASLAKYQQELDAALKQLSQLGADDAPAQPQPAANASPAPSNGEGVPQTNLETSQFQDEIRNLEALVAKAQEELVNLEVYKEMGGHGRHPGGSELEQAIAKEMEQDAAANELRQKLLEQQAQLQSQLAEAKNPNSAPIKKLRAAIQLNEAELNKHQAQLEKSLREKLAHIPAEAKAKAEAHYNTRHQAAKANLAKRQQDLAAARAKSLNPDDALAQPQLAGARASAQEPNPFSEVKLQQAFKPGPDNPALTVDYAFDQLPPEQYEDQWKDLFDGLQKDPYGPQFAFEHETAADRKHMRITAPTRAHRAFFEPFFSGEFLKAELAAAAAKQGPAVPTKEIIIDFTDGLSEDDRERIRQELRIDGLGAMVTTRKHKARLSADGKTTEPIPCLHVLVPKTWQAKPVWETRSNGEKTLRIVNEAELTGAVSSASPSDAAASSLPTAPDALREEIRDLEGLVARAQKESDLSKEITLEIMKDPSITELQKKLWTEQARLKLLSRLVEVKSPRFRETQQLRSDVQRMESEFVQHLQDLEKSVREKLSSPDNKESTSRSTADYRARSRAANEQLAEYQRELAAAKAKLAEHASSEASAATTVPAPTPTPPASSPLAWQTAPSTGSNGWNNDTLSRPLAAQLTDPWAEAAAQPAAGANPAAINPPIVAQPANQPASASSAWNQNAAPPYAGVAETSPFAPPYHASYATNGGDTAGFANLVDLAKNKHNGSVTWDNAFTTLHVYGQANLHASVQQYLQRLSTKHATNPPTDLDRDSITGRNRKVTYQLRIGARPTIEQWFAEHPDSGVTYYLADPNKTPILVARGEKKAHERLQAALVSLGIHETVDGDHVAPQPPTVAPTPAFPSLENQKIADRAYKLLGWELESLTPEELEIVKQHGYSGGLRIEGSRSWRPGVVANELPVHGDLLVGLHTWPIRNLDDLNEVLTQHDLSNLSPLKFHIISRFLDRGNQDPWEAHEGAWTLMKGRINVESLPGDAPPTANAFPVATAPVQERAISTPLAGDPGSSNQGGAATSNPTATNASAEAGNATRPNSDSDTVKVLQPPKSLKTGLFSTGSTTTAYLQVKRHRDLGVFGSAGKRVTPQEIERQAMNCLTLAKSPAVLRSALDVAHHAETLDMPPEDAVAWLEKRLSAAFPGDGEILELKLEDGNAKEDSALLQAVIDAFIAKVNAPPESVADPASASATVTLKPGDSVLLKVAGAFPEQPIDGLYRVEAEGTLPLGPTYGRVAVAGKTALEAEAAVQAHLSTILSESKTQLTIGEFPQPASSSEPTFLYDGKTFAEWRDLWKHELKTERRIEAINALAAFARTGYAQEATDAILAVAAEYPEAYSHASAEGRLMEVVEEAISRIPAKHWMPQLQERIAAAEEADRKPWIHLVARFLNSTQDRSEAARQMAVKLSQISNDDLLGKTALYLYYGDRELSQPITIETMRRALRLNPPGIDVAYIGFRHVDKLPELVDVFVRDPRVRQQLRGSSGPIENLAVLEMQKPLFAILHSKDRAEDHLGALRALKTMAPGFRHSTLAEPRHKIAEELIAMLPNTPPELLPATLVAITYYREEGSTDEVVRQLAKREDVPADLISQLKAIDQTRLIEEHNAN